MKRELVDKVFISPRLVFRGQWEHDGTYNIFCDIGQEHSKVAKIELEIAGRVYYCPFARTVKEEWFASLQLCENNSKVPSVVKEPDQINIIKEKLCHDDNK